MTTRTAFCSTCKRDVYLPEDSSAVCPVCSSPLIETVERTSKGTVAFDAVAIGPELYLG